MRKNGQRQRENPASVVSWKPGYGGRGRFPRTGRFSRGQRNQEYVYLFRTMLARVQFTELYIWPHRRAEGASLSARRPGSTRLRPTMGPARHLGGSRTGAGEEGLPPSVDPFMQPHCSCHSLFLIKTHRVPCGSDGLSPLP